MPDLLFELFSEEIPARMQKQAAADLQRLVTNALVDRGLTYEGAKAFATPRRLALNIVGLPARQPDTREEKKGPRVGSPEAAVQGFLKSAGLSDISQAKIESDPKKGGFYVAVIEKKGGATLDVLAEVLPEIIRAFPWPKSMRWGAASTSSSSLRWVRPLRGILATFGEKTEEPEIVPFDVDGLRAGNITYGHRFMAPAAIQVKRFDDYVAKLEAAKVVLDSERRKDIIRHDARDLAFAQGLEVIEDESLLEEVAGLVEWPVVLMGSFEAEFLDVPAEVIRATIRANQKCFVLQKNTPSWTAAPSDLPSDPLPTLPQGGGEGVTASGTLPSGGGGQGGGSQAGGDLANRFLMVANIEARDGGETIIGGNERVIRARLSDAKFFWDTDRKVWKGDPEFKRLEKFKNVTFHEKLGSQWDRIERIRALASALCKVTGADAALVDRAVTLCKADLLTEVVGEFPEVQGLMGRKYAALNGEHASVAAACEEHYKPAGPNDSVPTDKVSVTLALADKLDTLVGFWAIDEKPTGSKDPYALRRAALGVIRLVVENGVSGELRELCLSARSVALQQECEQLIQEQADKYMASYEAALSDLSDVNAALEAGSEPLHLFDLLERDEKSRDGAPKITPEIARRLAELHVERYSHVEWQAAWNIIDNLVSFFHDRLKVMLRDQGARHDLVDAVLADTPSRTDPLPTLPQGGGEGGGEGGEGGTASGTLPSGGGQGGGASAGSANDDLLLVVRRVEALGKFLDTEDGKSLLAGFKRAANILRAEEKKDGEGAFEAEPEASRLIEPEEKALHGALSTVGEAASAALGQLDFEGAMQAMATLRVPVDAFFEAVMVNADDPAIRKNRLALLASLRRVTAQIADFSKITG